MLRGRRSECEALDRLLEAVRGGRSGALVVRGEAGVGKTALLDYAIESASDLRVVRAVAVESEMELAFASLHQLCAPMLDRIDRLPGPQHDALGIVFGLRAGTVPDQFFVGLAVLSLLSEVAEERPLVCVVDDAQWLDRASAQTLGFVARRLLAESVLVLFAGRETGAELRGLPELEVRGLRDGDARELLGSVIRGPLDERVRERIVAETRGNPLALLELPKGLSSAQLAGGFGLPSGQSLPGRIEENFRRRLGDLPEETQRLVLVAAAEPVGDPALLWAAAQRLGIMREALAPAVSAGLLEVSAQVRFRHPLVRSAVYWSASAQECRAAHQALAEATDRELDPDRRAWHLSAASAGPDEEVASELEASAGRAQARGGVAAAAAFLHRAVVLTRDPARQAARALAAAQVNVQAGAFDTALELLATAEAAPLGHLERAQVDLVRGQVAFASSAGSEASALLLKAAKRIEPLDVGLARQTYLDAWAAALFAGRLARAGDMREVSRAAKSAAQPASAPSPSDLLLDGLAVLVTDGRGAAASMLRRVATVFAQEEIGSADGLRWGWVATIAPIMLWDEETWHTIEERQLQSAREAGLLVYLLIYVNEVAMNATWRGDLAAAASLTAEGDAIAEATGTRFAPYGALMLAGLRGSEAEATRLIADVMTAARVARQGVGIQVCHWVSAVLYNALGRYEDALSEAKQAVEDTPELWVSAWALPELIEAATRAGETGLAEEALEPLAEATSAGRTDWGLGIYARCRALLSEGEEAEGCYREAIDRLSRTRLRPDLARAHLLYGEWLRRAGRRLDARHQLRTAREMFMAMGVEGFADRAERELLATGERVRKRTAEALEDLTPQEAQIAQLARDGLSNAEIGAQLFISPRTVEYHLRKVFAKFNISARGQLDRAIPREQSGARAV
ncbi:MAG: AAA family ATPase [Solirubrobacteraceae bacterium]